MTNKQKAAYEWAKSHDYPSIAARHARELAGLVDTLMEQQNEPLTLEELLQMDGQPVWIPLEPPASVWALVSASEGNNPVFTFPEGEQCFIEEWLEEIGPVYRCDVSSL